MKLTRRHVVGGLAAAVAGILPTLSLAQATGTIAIITPSHDIRSSRPKPMALPPRRQNLAMK